MRIPKLELISALPERTIRPTPILFVHGAWHGAWCWQEHFLPYFAAQGYACHALSLRGHGESEGHERLRWHRAQDFVRDIGQVAGQLDTPPIVVGHSMGGYLVQKYLERHEAPAGILLASVPAQGVWRVTLKTLRRFPLHFLRLNLRLSLWPLMETPAMARFHLFGDDMPEALVRRYQERLQDESYRGYLDMMLLDLPRPGRVKTPLLVLGAAEDQIFGPHEIEATAAAYGTTAQIFPGLAHDVMLDEGWQTVAEAMVEWLTARGL